MGRLIMRCHLISNLEGCRLHHGESWLVRYSPAHLVTDQAIVLIDLNMLASQHLLLGEVNVSFRIAAGHTPLLLHNLLILVVLLDGQCARFVDKARVDRTFRVSDSIRMTKLAFHECVLVQWLV